MKHAAVLLALAGGMMLAAPAMAQDDEPLGPAKGAKTLSLGANVNWGGGATAYNARIGGGFFTTSRLELAADIGVNGISGGGVDTHSIVVLARPRYHFVPNNPNARFIPYVGLDVGGVFNDPGTDQGVIGGTVGADLFLKRGQAIFGEFQYLSAFSGGGGDVKQLNFGLRFYLR